MRKIVKVLLAVMMLLAVSGCGAKEELKEVPAGFCSNYEEAVFDKFNSNASENGLGGTKVWVEGTYKEILTMDTEGLTMYYTTFKAKDGHEWVLMLDAYPAAPKEPYEKLYGHTLCAKGSYEGYSSVYAMPVIYLHSLYDRNTGSILGSAAFAE